MSQDQSNNPPAQVQIETQFLKQFNRIKEGIRLARYVEWDAEEHCFTINEHKIFFDNNLGWFCDCKDRQYRAIWWCKHLAALVYYMGGMAWQQMSGDSK